MAKTLTSSQMIGEIGEAAARLRFLNIGFQFDGRSRLETGVDGIAEVMSDGRPLARMIAVQVKATESRQYTSESDSGFSYLLRVEDLEYWRSSNLPVIIVLYRKSDESFYWKAVPTGFTEGERRLEFDKKLDVLNRDAVDRLAALTVPKAGIGYYVPPLGGGETALVNILPVNLPSEMYVATTPYSPRKAASILLEGDEPARFDWVIRGEEFWSFHDPRQSCCREIVDVDQVEVIDTDDLAFHENIDEQNNFIFLLNSTLKHATYSDLGWSKSRKLLYFRAEQENTSRFFAYEASKRPAETEVVNVVRSKTEPETISFVRHHAFAPRFERLVGQWYLVITPTYYFTTNGYAPHPYPAALLSGKKRLDNSSALRGQVIMWHRFLTANQRPHEPDLLGFVSGIDDLLAAPDADSEVGGTSEQKLTFDVPPSIQLRIRVPEDVWGATEEEKRERKEKKEKKGQEPDPQLREEQLRMLG